MTKQQKIEETALVQDEPSKGVKRKAEEQDGAKGAEQEGEPPAKDAKSEQHAAAGAHARCLGLCFDCSERLHYHLSMVSLASKGCVPHRPLQK